MGDNHKTFKVKCLKNQCTEMPKFTSKLLYVVFILNYLNQCVQTNTGVPRGVRSNFNIKISNEYMIKSKEPGTMPQFVMLPNYASILRVDSKLFNCNPWANPGSSEGFQSLI